MRDLVNFYTYGPCSEPERFLFVRRCNIEDFDMGVGTLIEAMVVAGFPVGEIAALLGIPMSHVSAYIMVYCDYTEISTEVLPSLIMSPSHNAAVRLPQFLLMAAYWHGCEGLMFALTPHIAPTDVERETLRRMLNHPTALSLPSRCPDVPMTVARSKSPGHTYLMLLERLFRMPRPAQFDERLEHFAHVVIEVGKGVPLKRFVDQEFLNWTCEVPPQPVRPRRIRRPRRTRVRSRL